MDKNKNILAKAHSEAQSNNKKSKVFTQTQQDIDAARNELANYNAEADRRDKEPVGFGGAVSAIAEGAMNEFADRTTLGRIVARPFMDTPGEQRNRLDRRLMTAQQDNVLNSQADANRMRQEKAWKQDITAHGTAINKHITGTLEANPRYMVMTDKQKLAIKNNPSVQKFLNTNTLFRMGIDVFVNGKDRGAMDYYAKKLGVKITQKDGKNYIQFPDPDSKPIELNHTNFVALHNDINKKASQDIATLVALEEQKTNLPGIARGQKVHQIAKHFGNSVTQADNYHKAFMAGYDGIEQRKHYAVVGMDKIFEDGKVDPQEKEELLAQLGFLSERMGIKNTQDAEGNIFIINEDGTHWPIQQFHEELKAKDKIGIEWKKRVQELNLITMQKAQLANAKREAKLAELGYGKKAQDIFNASPEMQKQVNKYSSQIFKGSTYDDETKRKYKDIVEDFDILRKNSKDIHKLRLVWFELIDGLEIDKDLLPFPFEKKYKSIMANKKELKGLADNNKKAKKKGKAYHRNIKRKATTGQRLTDAEKSNIPFGSLGNR